ncbi:unnamed protein product [Ostreobium quekettii]|uniref:HTH myb-type domain-containing protein n=1 Tax=Ostreobium quekettii TaxID=121088 RepID=A0A8S1ILI9_9CHLO|nr:unnamed protein product [Ostreobium quekettii]|eukprot:evm.model.scf_94.11 EVM.evm.TU.scf_94.11   scf_94:84134-85216(+)
MSGGRYGDVMSAWRIGPPPPNGAASAQQGAAWQAEGSDLPLQSELVPIQQALMPPALAEAFCIPVVSVPFCSRGAYEAEMGPREECAPAVGTGPLGGVPAEVQAQAAPLDPWMHVPGMPPYLFPGGGIGRGFIPGGDGTPPLPQVPGVSLPLAPGAINPGRGAGFSGLNLLPQMAPEDVLQRGCGREGEVVPALARLPVAEPAPQWKGLPGLGTGQEQQQQQQRCSPEGKPQRRTRVFWTSELKKRFENAVGDLGLDHATPKQILRLMSVEGLTRENVASHLQKFRVKHKKVEDQARHKKVNSVASGGSTPGSPGGARSKNDETVDEDEPEASQPAQAGEQQETSACNVPPVGMEEDGCT